MLVLIGQRSPLSGTDTHAHGRGTLAQVQWAALGRAPDQPQRVAAADWVDAPSESVMVEHAAGSPELGTVISMIWPEGSGGAQCAA